MDYCQRNLGMEVYCCCLMPSHIHLIFRAEQGNPAEVLGRFKEFTSKQVQKSIEANNQESRKEWMFWMMERAASKSSNVSGKQLWQHHNQPIELWSNEVIDQKVAYIHMNPVESGFVDEAEHWRYSSARNYCGMKGLLEIKFLD
ncbi:MAG: transposase [Marinoscillum sp.]